MRRAPALLRAWRAARGVSQSEAGHLIGLRQYEWSRLETGERMPAADEASRIARITGGAVPVGAWEDIPRRRVAV